MDGVGHIVGFKGNTDQVTAYGKNDVLVKLYYDSTDYWQYMVMNLWGV